MIEQRQSTVRLRRSIPGRLFAGFFAQWVLTLALAINLFLIVVVASLGGLGDLLPAFPAMAVFWVIWGMGVTATSRADDDGVHWRYYRSRTYPWPEIERIRFGGRRIKGSVQFGQPAILIGMAGKQHPLTPAYGCGRRRLVEFGNGLIALAEARGVAVDLDPQDARWTGLRRG